MVINKDKTKIIKFSKSRKWDFPPELTFNDGTEIECVPTVKIVDVIVSQDLKWFQNSEFICKKSQKKAMDIKKNEEHGA